MQIFAKYIFWIITLFGNLNSLMVPRSMRGHAKRLYISKALNSILNISIKTKNEDYTTSILSHLMQDIYLSKLDLKCNKLMIFLIPEYHRMSGGIHSTLSIINELHKIKYQHGYEIICMTVPNESDITIFRNSFFRNCENIFRFDQIKNFKFLNDIYLNIPEYFVASFLHFLNDDHLAVLKSKNLHINILNQNIKLMPSPEAVQKLNGLTSNISQTVGHHKYYEKVILDRYKIPALLLPAWTDLSTYVPMNFLKKEKIIIYSPDTSEYKNQVINNLKLEFPDFELIEINNITFEQFIDLSQRCLFSLTFGEGYDGYFANPIRMGGISFAVYNSDFFPSDDYLSYPNIFQSGDDMLNNLTTVIRELYDDEKKYLDLNASLREKFYSYYSENEYLKQINKFSLKKFDYIPREQ